jgi:hypothetical protein
MSMTAEIMSQLPVPTLAERLGTDEATAREAAEAALPTLLAGLTGEATNPFQRPRLAAAARRDHEPELLHARDPLAEVDPADGDRIVDHVLGGQRGEVEGHLRELVGGDAGDAAAQVLPLLAPLVMAWVAGKMRGPSRGTEPGAGLGDILGDILGGGTSGAMTGGLRDILGDVLGGSSPTSSPQGGFAGILGGLIGGLEGGGVGELGSSSLTEGGPGKGRLTSGVLHQLGGRAGVGDDFDDLLSNVFRAAARR